MTYLFDTSVIIDFLRKKKSLYDFIASHTDDEIIVSSICVFELYSGIGRNSPSTRDEKTDLLKNLLESFSKIISFDASQAEIAGMLESRLDSKGITIGDIDILIAACAISEGATLVTNNVKHFNRIKELTVLSP